MKLTAGILILLLAVVIPSLGVVSDDIGRDNSGPVITALDVCHAATPGAVSSADAPLIYEYAFALHESIQQSDVYESVDPAVYEVFLSTLERPPQS